MQINKNLNILEVGPGLGVNLQTLNKYGEVDILEIDAYFVDQIQKNYKNINHFSSLEQINKNYDLIVMLDVLEHIEDTHIFLKKINEILAEKGSLILSVPAYQKLFSEHDIEMQHFRRYSTKLLKNTLNEFFMIQDILRYNSFLLPLRVLQIIFFKNINSEVGINNFINVIFKKIINFEVWLNKKRIRIPFGLSIFCIAKKTT